jgi:hypothetical protein
MPMAKPWFVKRSPERGYGYGLGSWQGAIVLAIFLLAVLAGLAFIPLSGGSTAGLLLTAICCVGASLWLARMIRAHRDREA